MPYQLHMTMRNSNWKRYVSIYRNLPTAAAASLKSKENRINFLQFNKQAAANERNASLTLRRSLSASRRSKLNKFIFVFLFPKSEACHDTGNEILFLLNSIIMEINYSAPRFVSSLFGLTNCMKVCNLIYVFGADFPCNVAKRIRCELWVNELKSERWKLFSQTRREVKRTEGRKHRYQKVKDILNCRL